jgi:hypothetical protein
MGMPVELCVRLEERFRTSRNDNSKKRELLLHNRITPLAELRLIRKGANLHGPVPAPLAFFSRRPLNQHLQTLDVWTFVGFR